jgi:hypothetical protein
MLVDLSAEEIVLLIRSEWPEYEIMDHIRIRMFGRYVGGMNDRWVWEPASSPVWDLREDQLYETYVLLRLAHWGPKVPPPVQLPENPQDFATFYRSRNNQLLFGKS